jgi:Tol biopolymer transport system component
VSIETGDRGLQAGQPEIFLQTPFNEFAPAFSPEGRWIAYSSNESGALEVYVLSFPNRRGKRRVSNSGGAFPSWSRSGRELLFRAEDGRIMVAEYTLSGDAFITQKPRIWSERRLRAAETGFFARDFDLAPDGKRVVAFMPAEEPNAMAQNHVFFLANFFDELRRRTQPR